MIRSLFSLAILLMGFMSLSAQTDEAPIKETELNYKDWTYSKIHDENSINLRNFAKDKKLVLVIYFAPWCHNSKHQAPILQKLYEKYSAKGLGVIGVGEYGSVEDIKTHVAFFNVTFPVVFESSSRKSRKETLHYEYRIALGDTREWGTPWNLFFEPLSISEKGDTLVKKAFIAEGELSEIEAEKFIRQKLGLPAEQGTTANASRTVEVCDESVPDLKKPKR